MPNVRTQLKPPRMRSRFHDRTSLLHPAPNLKRPEISAARGYEFPLETCGVER
jgi:hypothetical protein